MTYTEVMDLSVLKAIDIFLEGFYPQSVIAGTDLAKAELKTAQIRGLETLIMSASRFSEVINYIKNQAGKERKESRWGKVAPILLSQLESLGKEAERIAEGNAAKLLDIKLQLARGWARQVVAHYLFASKK